MKTSLDLPDDLYRLVKSKSALEGKAVREVATALFTAWVNSPMSAPGSVEPDMAATPETPNAVPNAVPNGVPNAVPNASQQWLARWRELGADVTQATPGADGLLKQLSDDRR